MKQNKWYVNLVSILIAIICSPLILIALIWVGLVNIPEEKKAYKNSVYYKELGYPYCWGITDDARYRFYNGARKRNLPIEYIKQSSNTYEYFVFNHVIYILPDFDDIMYSEERKEWLVNSDDGWYPLTQSASLLDDTAPDLPVIATNSPAEMCSEILRKASTSYAFPGL